MVRSCRDLCSNPNFVLKIAVFVLAFLGDSVNYPYPLYYYVVSGYRDSCLGILFTLIIAYIFFDSTKVTEVWLLLAALSGMLMATLIYAVKARESFELSHPGNAQPDPFVKSRHSHASKIITTSEDPLVPESSNIAYDHAESDNSQYSIYLAMNFTSIILILIDIILRCRK